MRPSRRRTGLPVAVGPLPGSFASDPSLRTNSGTAFGEDEQRGYKQRAFSPPLTST